MNDHSYILFIDANRKPCWPAPLLLKMMPSGPRFMLSPEFAGIIKINQACFSLEEKKGSIKYGPSSALFS
ncbi:MAG: hypothetical protein OP8BY_0441 [Candidatus Saccharicenans subterraneus]|uniref:Uncharacterized protein n=1 Tax=Candidatus Saccharicenans subterraneus TaxID=2508984 RepID=A0A3E2BKZ6_9BACT|nr:MAG: hypothetical protein OP8BY_0441 [Candidatus Saccharicenans subterraneum]